ncbi:DUF5954 family protein [Streptomyces camelliae]|uniref:DUF5954 family protein n=1 Tax=Streptomyces camelliae TaxID=3004093 RepID=A0ABY7PIB7_9ACTN|nr:DUF5954 family protein [Streptomyces sp. HUAS 2-6]WBO69484.1 DUF5954 family protein [Streptomyces sp. HUAS 2-6]
MRRFPAPGSRLPAPGSRLPAPGSRLPAPGSRLPAPGSRLPAPGSRLPEKVRAASHRALTTHPDVLLLPATFKDSCLTWFKPRRRGLLPEDAGRQVDARTHVAENAGSVAEELTAYTEAADRLRVGRVSQVGVLGTVYRIGRTRRLLQLGA